MTNDLHTGLRILMLQSLFWRQTWQQKKYLAAYAENFLNPVRIANRMGMFFGGAILPVQENVRQNILKILQHIVSLCI